MRGRRTQGGIVQPVPGPLPIKKEVESKINAGTMSQKLILFKRGKAISDAPIIKGTNQLPNPPIKIGITIKLSKLIL